MTHKGAVGTLPGQALQDKCLIVHTVQDVVNVSRPSERFSHCDNLSCFREFDELERCLRYSDLKKFMVCACLILAGRLFQTIEAKGKRVFFAHFALVEQENHNVQP